MALWDAVLLLHYSRDCVCGTGTFEERIMWKEVELYKLECLKYSVVRSSWSLDAQAG